MAIVIEEERHRLSLISLLSWIVILVVIVLAVYFLFIKNPGKVEVVLPGFEHTEQITRIYLDPNTLVSGPLSTRRQYITPPTPGIVGRENPFLPLGTFIPAPLLGESATTTPEE